MHQRWLAVWLVGLTLLMRIAVPVGYMPMFSAHSITVELCSGYGPMKMAIAMSGMPDHRDKNQHGKGEMPCGFSALSSPSLAGTDPIQLTLAIALIIAVTRFGVTPLQVIQADRLRPPLRGPPLTA